MVRNAAAASDGKTHPDELKSEVGDGQERFPGSRKYGGPERASFRGSGVISLCLHSPFLHTDTIFGLHLVVPPSSRKPGNALRSQSDFNRSNPHTQQEKNSLSASLPRNPQIHRLPLARTGSRVHVWANNCTGSLTSPNWLRPIRAHLRRYRQNSSHPNCTRRIEGGGAVPTGKVKVTPWEKRKGNTGKVPDTRPLQSTWCVRGCYYILPHVWGLTWRTAGFSGSLNCVSLNLLRSLRRTLTTPRLL